jgi:hypothetical protein
MPDLLDRPADFGQHILADWQTIFPKEAHHGPRYHVVKQSHRMGVVGEVLPSQIGNLLLAQGERGGVKHDVAYRS